MNKRVINTNFSTYFKGAKDNENAEVCVFRWKLYTTAIMDVWGNIQACSGGLTDEIRTLQFGAQYTGGFSALKLCVHGHLTMYLES